MAEQESGSDNKKEVITLKNIHKKLKNKIIINNVSLSVPDNSIYAIIGPNGAGKTTLLRLILDMLKVDSGDISFAFDNRRIAVLLENDYLFEKKTGYENIDSFTNYFQIDNNELLHNKIEVYSKLLKLDSYLNNKVNEYSKGMKRKLSILITILRDFHLIIFDEPTSGVDPQSRIDIRQLFNQLKNEGKTILITSHDLSEVEKISDVISIINEGEVIATFTNTEKNNLENIFFEILGGENRNE